jgi:hypothetical protein
MNSDLRVLWDVFASCCAAVGGLEKPRTTHSAPVSSSWLLLEHFALEEHAFYPGAGNLCTQRQ